MSKNKNFHKAKKSKQDEFYTQLSDIEEEMRHYSKHFKDKVIYCNCDDPIESNFWYHFSHKFETYAPKKLIATCYKNTDRDLFSENKEDQGLLLEYTGDKNNNKIPDPEEIGIKELKGDGDGGVTGYGAKLNIRPPYQREFVYKDEDRRIWRGSIFTTRN